MVFEAHSMYFPCTELLLFNYAKIKRVFHSMAPLNTDLSYNHKIKIYFNSYDTVFEMIYINQIVNKTINE